MAGNDDVKKMARDFLDLWQKQLNSMIKEPDITGQMLKNLQDMQKKFFEAQADVTNSYQPDLPEHGDDELLQLDKRIRACEQRLDALEQEIAGGSGGTSEKGKRSS